MEVAQLLSQTERGKSEPYYFFFAFLAAFMPALV
jgi:hypothetical protein